MAEKFGRNPTSGPLYFSAAGSVITMTACPVMTSLLMGLGQVVILNSGPEAKTFEFHRFTALIFVTISHLAKEQFWLSICKRR